MPTVPTLKERVGSLLGDTTTADATFIVGEERVRIPAHAMVMSIASDSFRAMFFGDFNRERVVEGPGRFAGRVSSVDESNPSSYVYTDEVEITEDNAEAVIQLADKYLLAGLFGDCVEWLKQNVTAANVCSFQPLGELYADVEEVCWERMLRHGDDSLNSEAFLSLPQDLLARMFASDQLAADEVTVYRRAIDWAKRQLEGNGQPENPCAVRATLGTLLYLIRFPLFAAEEFANGPSESGVLSAEECISIFQWFNASKKPPVFSVDVRASSMLDIDRVLQQLGAPRRGTCEHEQGVKTNLKELRKRCARNHADPLPAQSSMDLSNL